MDAIRLITHSPDSSVVTARLLREFAQSLNQRGFYVVTDYANWFTRFIAHFIPCRLTLVVGFSHFRALVPQGCCVVPNSPSLVELKLARRLAATLGGVLNRGLRSGRLDGIGVLREREYDHRHPLLPDDGQRLGIMLGGVDSFMDNMAVNRTSNRLFTLLSEQVTAHVKEIR